MTTSTLRALAVTLVTAGALGAEMVGAGPASATTVVTAARASSSCQSYYQTSVADEDKAHYYASRYQKTHAPQDRDNAYLWTARAKDARKKYDECEAAAHHH